MRRLIVLPALVLAAFLPGTALAGEGCAHAKEAVTTAAMGGAGVSPVSADSCGENCPHAATAGTGADACPHAAAMANGGSCKAGGKATTAGATAPNALLSTSPVANAE